MDRKYITAIRDYYLNETLAQYDWTKIKVRFEHAAIIIIHSFQSPRVRDIDNRNRKYLIDAIKRTRLIQDDCWQAVSLFEKGVWNPNKEDHINVYVLEEKFLPAFLDLMNVFQNSFSG